MVFSQKPNTHRILKLLAKALIRLRVCAGWSEALLVAHTKMLEISCNGSDDILPCNLSGSFFSQVLIDVIRNSFTEISFIHTLLTKVKDTQVNACYSIDNLIPQFQGRHFQIFSLNGNNAQFVNKTSAERWWLTDCIQSHSYSFR